MSGRHGLPRTRLSLLIIGDAHIAVNLKAGELVDSWAEAEAATEPRVSAEEGGEWGGS